MVNISVAQDDFNFLFEWESLTLVNISFQRVEGDSRLRLAVAFYVISIECK